MPPLGAPKTHKMRLVEEEQVSHKISLNLSRVTFLKITNFHLHEHGTFIYSVIVLKLKWENSNEKHLNLAPKPMSHGRCDFVSSSHKP